MCQFHSYGFIDSSSLFFRLIHFFNFVVAIFMHSHSFYSSLSSLLTARCFSTPFFIHKREAAIFVIFSFICFVQLIQRDLSYYQECFPIFCCMSINTAKHFSSVINKSATKLPKRSAISMSSFEKLAMVHGTPPMPFTTHRGSPEESLASLPTYLHKCLLLHCVSKGGV